VGAAVGVGDSVDVGAKTVDVGVAIGVAVGGTGVAATGVDVSVATGVAAGGVALGPGGPQPASKSSTASAAATFLDGLPNA
jgi:hypothetical protein